MSSIYDGIIGAIIDGVNKLIAALGAVLAGVVSLLPDMPGLPTWPTPFQTAKAWVAWFVPVQTVLDGLAFVVIGWLAWQLVAIALRRAKALS